MKKLVVSSGNKNKIKEIREILKGLDLEVVSKDDLGFKDFDVVEDGETLEENSRKKAVELSKKIDYMVMADDSGLFVDYLGGEPGINSARYSGIHGNDQENNKKLLRALEGVGEEGRTAGFKAVISLVTEDKQVYSVEGEIRGKISFEPLGEEGFGYDPLFIPEGYSKSFAQLSSEEKNKVSHRYRAIVKLKNLLEDIL